MKFQQLAKYLERLEKTASRNEMTQILADLFKKSDKKEIDKMTYLLLGRLAPSYEEVVFNIAERMMLQIVATAYEQKSERVKKLYKQKGDLGDVAYELGKRLKVKGKSLSVSEVYEKLLGIAKDEGGGSQERKVNEAAKLFNKLDPLSARYVARIPVGKLRLGFSDKTIIDALSWMLKGDKSAARRLEKAYHVIPDVGSLAERVKEVGLKKAVQNPKPEIGIPVLPMLAQRLKSPSDMIKKMGKVAVEPKFDGLRIQVHFKSGKKGFIKAFTRNLNETSWMFPELKKIKTQIKAKAAILDCEAVGVDEERKKLANFQTTMTRRRKHEIEESAEKIPIKFYVFDALLVDGKSLMDEPYIKRREALAKVIKKGKILELVDYEVTDKPEKISELMKLDVEEGLEGVIVKRADSRYVPGRTGWRWVKMKEAETARAKLADTLDLVVMGYTRGKGKRAQFGIGQFLVGLKDGEKIKTVTKIGTGLTDEQFKDLATRLKRLEVSRKPKEYEVHKDLEPDFWVKPLQVVEIAADEITKSPKHTAGYALRFPRLVKFRDDKGLAQATTLGEAKKLYKMQ